MDNHQCALGAATSDVDQSVSGLFLNAAREGEDDEEPMGCSAFGNDAQGARADDRSRCHARAASAPPCAPSQQIRPRSRNVSALSPWT
jgi:hypothetical protein